MKNENKVSTRADLLTRRTYCRPKEDGTFETWEDVVNRVIEHQRWLWIRARFGYSSLSEEQEAELQALKELMLQRKVSMSGRTLWLGGTEIARTRESSMFNCSFLKIETVYDVVDAFWLLLQGCGVGFKPVRGTLNGFFKPIKNIEVIRSTKKLGERGRETNLEKVDKRNKVWTLSIGDSAEAWAKSIGKLLAGKHNVDKLVLDFSEIRSAGERLKGYGWISSGDEAISKAYVAIANILNRKAGCLLSGIDLLDIINHLGTVLSSRRSAQICLMDAEDYEANQFITAKKDYWLSGNNQRAQSNNSILFWKKPSREQLESIFDRMIASGGSEPGFINAEAATRRAPFFSGGNPCFEVLLANKSFCVHGTTPLITRTSLVEIQDVVGKQIEVWNGVCWSKVTPRVTGTNQKMLQVTFSDGTYLTCTEYHRFSVKDRFGKDYKEVIAKDLLQQSKYRLHTEPFKIEYTEGKAEPLAYTYGVAYGDGYSNKIDLYGEKCKLPVLGTFQNTKYRQNEEVVQIRVVVPFNIDTFDIAEVFLWDRSSILQFVAGLADTDGSNTESGGIRIYQSDESFLRKLQLLLTKVGVRSSLNLMAKAGTQSNFNRTKDSWYLQITDCSEIPCHRLITNKGHSAKFKGKWQNIVSVQEVEGLHTSYCFEEPMFHKAVFNNTLTFQCNLSEIDLGKFVGDTEGLLEAIRLVGRANYRQTCVNLQDGLLQEAWHLNNEFLRLCGVGLTGITRRDDLMAYDYRSLERAATSACYSMADELGMQRPKNCTVVKPSGTLSKIMDTTEGLHKPLGKYIFNNVVFSNHDECLDALREANYRVFAHPFDTTSCVVTFPVCWNDIEFDVVNGVEVNLESAVLQLDKYKLLQDNYTQQNSSVTISYDVSEKDTILDWFMQNWDSYVGVSFLFRNDPTKTAKDLGYAYLPQEVVTKEVFEAYVSTLNEVVFSNTSDAEVDAGGECAGGVCPVK